MTFKRSRAKRRDEFPAKVIRKLSDEVGRLCSLCYAPTSGPSAEPGKTTNIGTAAHITAAAPGGPRFDSTLSVEERRSEANGIWCCRNCGKSVDDDTVIFTEVFLRERKHEAITRARQRLGVPEAGATAQPYAAYAAEDRHRIARDAARAVDGVRSTMPRVSEAWQRWRAQKPGGFGESIADFSDTIERLSQARDDVRAMWGEGVAAPMQTYPFDETRRDVAGAAS